MKTVIGIEGIKKEMNKMEKQADAYKIWGVKIPHIIANLTPKNGQTYVAEYITSILQTYKLRKFCGLDALREYKLDGTLKNVKQVFEDISRSAVYTNEFEGVIAIDVSALSGFTNEYQVDFFVDHIAKVGETATVIIYYNDKLGKCMEVIKDRICNAIGKYVEIHVEPYSVWEFSEIVMECLKKRGIEIEQINEELRSFICWVVNDRNISTAKEAAEVAEELLFYVDHKENIPPIDIRRAADYFCACKGKTLGGVRDEERKMVG